MDRVCHDILVQLNLPNLHVIPLEQFEADDKELLKAKENRRLIEYYFTCTPSLPLFIFNCHPEVDHITYLDADLFFFDSPKALYDEIGGHSIAIVEHRFPHHLRDLEVHGIYNVGWLYFKRDGHGLACLQSWREQCIEWCYDRVEDGRFADQKYLDAWPDRFSGVVVLHHKGANLAPWNISNYRVSDDQGRICVDEQPLIFFHFHGLKKVNGWLYNHNLADYRVLISAPMLRSIYAPYITTLLEVNQELLPFLKQTFSDTNIRYGSTESSATQETPPLRRLAKSLGRSLHLCREVVFRNYLIVINGRVL